MATRKRARDAARKRSRAAGGKATKKQVRTRRAPAGGTKGAARPLPPPDATGHRAWLAKTEPDVYSIDDLARDGRTSWGGVRNFAARNHLAAMRAGDRVLVYHSNADPSAIVGVATVVREAYPDPTQFDASDEMGFDPKSKREAPTWVAVDLAYAQKLARPVTLDAVKREEALADMALVRISRLSVQPVSAGEWDAVLRLANE